MDWDRESGGFRAQQVLQGPTDRPSDAFAAHMNEGGAIDVPSASVTDGKLAWYRDLGGGTFSPQQVISTIDADPRALVAAALNGDSDTDILSAYAGGSRMLTNPGGGMFAASAPLSPQTVGAFALRVGDVDGDGTIDVLTASVFDDKVSLYRNWPTASTYGATCSAPAIDFAPTSTQGIGVPLSAREIHALVAVVALGLSRTSIWRIGAFPSDLSIVGMPGCMLLQSMEIFGLPTAPSPNPFLGQVGAAPPLPASANGLQVFAQAFSFTPSANALGVVASNEIA